MKKTFLTNLALLLMLNFLVKPFWVLGIDRTVQNVVGAESYGFYFSLFGFSLLLNIILDAGITNFNNRNIAQHHQLLGKYLSNIVTFKFILAIIYFAVSLVIAFIIGYTPDQIRLLLVLIFNQFVASFVLYLRSNLSGLHLFRTDSILSVLDRFLMILICGILLWGNITRSAFRIEWFVYAQTAAYLITALISFSIVLAKASFFKPRFDIRYFIIIFRQSYPFALLSLFMVFYYRVDSVMLERLLPDGKIQAGMYAQAYRILDAAAMVGFLFGGLLLPIFSRMLKRREPVEQLTQISYMLLIVPTVIVSLACIFFRSELMDLLYLKHVELSANILAVLMLGYIAISTSYIFGTLLTANGNLKAMNIMAGSGVLLNIILNLVLIPKYQALGSAIASLVTQTITALIQVVLVYRILRFSVNLGLIVRLTLLSVALILTGILLQTVSVVWFYRLFIFAGTGLLIAFLFRLLNIRILYRILRNGDTV
ncbi:MAG: oligosaccharide flippase family protein [Bacteroidales bacterium]|nr:MAG: oligosaccharide flippase family protein [Bacteroidales bacterium]